MELSVMQSMPYLVIEGIPKEGLHLSDDYWIGTDKELASAMAVKLRSCAGSLEAEHLAENPVYAYVLKRYAKGHMDDQDGLLFASQFANTTQMLLLAIWLVKDNSANGGTTYLRHDHAGDPDFLSVTRSVYFFTADCEFRTETLIKPEFDKAIEYLALLEKTIPKVNANKKRLSGLIHESRIARTLYFVQAARSADDLAVKIAFYCMCFESMFSTDKTGVTHRVSERTAAFLGGTGDDKKSTYKDTHELYSLRSATVHGARIKLGDTPKLVELTKRGDNYLRRCIDRMLREPAENKLFTQNNAQHIDDYFMNKLFQ